MNPIFSLRISATLALLSSIFLGPSGLQAADRTWLGGAGDSLWSTAGNWDATPVDGDVLIFSGTTQLSNTNDLSLTSTPGIRFDSDAFVLNGNGLTLSTGITNTVGTNMIGLNVTWGNVGRFFNVAAGSELVLAGTNAIGSAGDHTYLGGGRLRLKGLHVQAINLPATILNNIEYINDGGSFSNAGGVRITSGTTPTASKLILINGAVMSQTLAAGAIRVGDATGISGQLLMDYSTFRGATNTIHIPFASGGIGSVVQTGGTNSGSIINFCNNTTTGGTGSYDIIGGTLETTQIKKNAAIGNGTATMSFDGAMLRALPNAATAFFTGLNTAEIKSGGLTNDSNGETYTVGQLLSGDGRLTKMGSGVVTITGANTFAGGLTVSGGTVEMGSAGALGSGTLTFLNSSTFRGNNATARTITVPVTLGGNVTFSSLDALTFNNSITLTGNRTLTVNNTNTFNGDVGETGGARSLTKAGTGILVLNSSSNNYSGATTISAGTLTLGASGSLSNSSTITVAAGATFNISALGGGFTVGSGKTLKGGGTVSGAVNVSGTISPGNNVGTLTNGAVTLNTDSTLLWEINNTNVDSILASSLNIQGTTVKIDVTALETLTNWNNSAATNWVLVHTTGGGIANFDAGKFVIVDHFSASNSLAGGTFSVASNGTDLSLQFNPSTGDVQSRVLTTVTAGAATFTGLPGKGYTIQYTDSLGETWQTLTTVGTNGVVTTDGAGAGSFQDPTTPLPPQRYYRMLNP